MKRVPAFVLGIALASLAIAAWFAFLPLLVRDVQYVVGFWR